MHCPMLLSIPVHSWIGNPQCTFLLHDEIQQEMGVPAWACALPPLAPGYTVGGGNGPRVLRNRGLEGSIRTLAPDLLNRAFYQVSSIPGP